MIRHAPITLVKKLSDLPQLRQLPPGATQILGHIAPLIAWLECPRVIEDHAVDVEHLLVVLHFVGVLEKLPHHPGVSKDQIDALHGVLCGHCCKSLIFTSIVAICLCNSAIDSRCCCTISGGAFFTKFGFFNFASAPESCLRFS